MLASRFCVRGIGSCVSVVARWNAPAASGGGATRGSATCRGGVGAVGGRVRAAVRGKGVQCDEF
jgi:hypothetical protein